MRSVRIVIDSREKKPLEFADHLGMLNPDCLPEQKSTSAFRILKEKRTLEAADYVLADEHGVLYTLENSSSAGVIETKRSMHEVAQNLFDSHRRRNFIACLSRMRERFSHPLLLLEGGFDHLDEDDQYIAPGLVIDGLQRICMQNRIQLAILPTSTPRQRRLCGEYVARWLINAMLSPTPPE